MKESIARLADWAQQRATFHRYGTIFAVCIALLTLSLNDVAAGSCGHNGDVPGCEDSLQDRIALVASGFDKPYDMYIHNGDIFLTTVGSIVKVSSSGTTSVVAETPLGPPGGLVKYGDYIYYVDNINARLLRYGRDGTSEVVAEGLGFPNAIAEDDGKFIIIDIGTPTDDGTGVSRVLRVSTDGQIEVVASSLEQNLGGIAGIYVDEDGYWVADFINGRFLLVKRNGQVREIATGLGQPLDFEFDGHSFIVTDFGNGFLPGYDDKGRLLRITKDGQVTVIGAPGQVGNPGGLVLQGPDIIFTDLTAGTILRVRGDRLGVECDGNDCELERHDDDD